MYNCVVCRLAITHLYYLSLGGYDRNNVEGLMNISDKLVVPQLQAACLNFLLTHAAGKPIKALRIAELFDIDELYKEASRFVLENPGGWSESELSTLSKETLLKLEKRCDRYEYQVGKN